MPVADRDAELAYGITHQGEIPDPPEWWRGGLFYEVYLPSFQDTTGNGTGDLRGIIERLDYIRDLGVEAYGSRPSMPHRRWTTATTSPITWPSIRPTGRLTTRARSFPRPMNET